MAEEEKGMSREELLAIIEQAAREGWMELDLRGRGIRELPPEIGQLTNLEALNLASLYEKGEWHHNQLSQLPDEIGVLLPHHGHAGGGRGHDGFEAPESPEKASHQGASFSTIARVEVDLTAARLVWREGDLHTQSLQNPHGGLSRFREEGIVEAGEKEGDAHGSQGERSWPDGPVFPGPETGQS